MLIKIMPPGECRFDKIMYSRDLTTIHDIVKCMVVVKLKHDLTCLSKSCPLVSTVSQINYQRFDYVMYSLELP